MNAEVVLVPLVFTLAAAFLVAGKARSRPASIAASVAGGLALLATILWLRNGPYPYPVDEGSVENRPIAVSAAQYVSSDTCRSCHPQEYDSWHGSYHRTMT